MHRTIARAVGRTGRARAGQQARHYLVPFQDDLTPADLELFGLEAFQHYTPAATGLADVVRLAAPVVVTSRLTLPYVNLALEQYVYARLPPATHRLLFYANSPCVVVGRNQNPFREANLPLLEALRIPWLRRQSGGGTVVHGPGNINFSYLCPKEEFDRMWFAHAVVRAVNTRLGAERLCVNARGDITTLDGAKVSGSAYRVARGGAYHHGTMLLDANLGLLRKLLHRGPELGEIETAAVESVPSKVANLGMDQSLFVESVAGEFESMVGPATHLEILDALQLPPEVAKGAEELQLWQWKYGRTPKFTHTLRHLLGVAVRLVVEKGCLVDVSVDGDAAAFKHLLVRPGLPPPLQYSGSSMAGYVTDDALSTWLGEHIDGTV